MANKNSLPDYSEKQKLLFSESKDTGLLKSYGRQFLEAEMLDTALDFLLEANDKEEIKNIVNIAVENGDYYLFKKGAGFVMSQDEINEKSAELSKNAEKLGKDLFSERARNYGSKNKEKINTGKEEKVG